MTAKEKETASPGRAADKNSPEDSKELIMRAAVNLFAQKGYDGTGVREIAAQAGVNLAMINYFYGSKLGLLEQILEHFFSNYLRVAQEALEATGDDEQNLEAMVRTFVRRMVAFFSQNSDQMRVALMDLPFTAPQTAHIKADWVRRLAAMMMDRWSAILGGREHIAGVMAVVGPAIISMLASHFLLKPIISNVGLTPLDDKFYERYPEVLADLCLYGLGGLAERFQQGILPGASGRPPTDGGE